MSSGLEIERKFLVKKGRTYRDQAFNCTHIKQGYIPADGATIKSRSTDNGLSRYEFEKEISVDEAAHLMMLCKGGVIDKHRYLVKCGSHTFEVDEFHGDNEGLVMAEVELQNAEEPYEKPDFIGMEVTGEKRFYNSHMLHYPFKLWRESLPEAYR